MRGAGVINVLQGAVRVLRRTRLRHLHESADNSPAGSRTATCRHKCRRAGPSPLRKPDSHARFTEHNFIVRLQSNAAVTAEDRNRSAASHDLGSVFAAVVMQPELAGGRLVGEVRM